MTYIIAEAGINHCGDMSRAKALIDDAVYAGADAVKFQLYEADKLEPPGEARDLLHQCRIRRGDMEELSWYAKDKGISFLCTPFDPGSAKLLVRDMGVKIMKVASGYCRDDALLSAVNDADEVILSTGMATVSDIEHALGKLTGPKVTLMQCTSAYPTPPSDVNLRAMAVLHNVFGVDTGFSDHSSGIMIPIAAATLGAKCIEKHIRLEGDFTCPDVKVSVDKERFRQMVHTIRMIPMARGNGVKKVMPSEAVTIQTLERRREYASRIHTG
jgi:sialic acid synthase SpsE